LTTIVTSLDEIKNLSELEIAVLGSIFVKKVSTVGDSHEEALEKARKSTLNCAISMINKEISKNYEHVLLLDLKQNGADYEPITILTCKQNENGWTAQTITKTMYPVAYSCQSKDKSPYHLGAPVIVNNPCVNVPGYKKDLYSSQETMFKMEGTGTAATKEEAESAAKINAYRGLAESIMASPACILQFPVKNNITLISEICEKKHIGDNIEVTLDKIYNVFGVVKK
jgi:hypothetical protein